MTLLFFLLLAFVLSPLAMWIRRPRSRVLLSAWLKHKQHSVANEVGNSLQVEALPRSPSPANSGDRLEAYPTGGLERTYRFLDEREEQLKPFLQWPNARQELKDVRRCKADIARRFLTS